MILEFIIDVLLGWLYQSATEEFADQLWALHRSARPRSWKQNGEDSDRFWRGYLGSKAAFPAKKEPNATHPS